MPIDNRTYPRALRIISTLRFCRQLVTGNATASHPPLPISTRLKLAWHGFLPDKHHLYNLEQNDWRDYCSDWHILMSQTINGHYAAVLYDKILFESVVGRLGNVPRNYAHLDRGRVNWLNTQPEEQDSMLGMLRREQKLILKPRNADCGKGVHLLEFRDDGFWCDFEPIDEPALEDLIEQAEDTLVVEFVRQGEFANSLYPRSANTLRMVTMTDVDKGNPFFIFSGFRIGSDQSAPKDNMRAGGMFGRVDLETGQMGKARIFCDNDQGFEWIDRHPDTGVKFVGQVIPNWQAICDTLLEIVGKLPYISIASWDVAILDDGISIIEGNHWCPLYDYQVYGGLLTDPRVRAFCRHYHLIK